MKRPAARRKTKSAAPDVEEVSAGAPEEEASPARIGDNRPPGPSLDWDAEAWADHLGRLFVAAAERKADLLASYGRFDTGYPLAPPRADGEPVGIDKWDDDIQGRAGDLKAKLSALLTNAEAMHTIEKAPILVAQRAVDGFLRHYRKDLDDAVKEINFRRTIYGRYIEARNRAKAEEEAAQKAQEAAEAQRRAAATLEPEHLEQSAHATDAAEEAAKLAAAKPAEHSRVYGPAGSVSSLRDNWQFIAAESDIMELAKAVIRGDVPRTYLAFNEDRIKLAVKSEQVREIPGCVIRNEARVQ